MRSNSPHDGPPRGFSLVELLFSIAVVFLIMGLILAGLRYAVRGARSSADATTLNSLKTAVDLFRREFGFFPPLVKDFQPLTASTPRRPNVYVVGTPADLAFLRDPASPSGWAGAPPGSDLRFSVYAPAIFLMGALDAPVDGKDGPGFTTPTRDGAFTRIGRTFEPFFDTSRNPRALFNSDAANGKVELRDVNNVAFRFYRWMPDDQSQYNASAPINDFYNVPSIVGDPAADARLRSGEYAIVAAGRDGVFGDEMDLPPSHPQRLTPEQMQLRLGLNTTDPVELRAAAVKDNIVVVGGSK